MKIINLVIGRITMINLPVRSVDISQNYHMSKTTEP